MPAKKLSWFVAAAHADDRVDIFSTSDYERAHEVASALWQEELSLIHISEPTRPY